MLRKAAFGLVALLLLVLVLVGGVVAAAQTQLGKSKIAGLIEGALAAPGRKVEVRGLDGFLPFDIRLGRLALHDEQGAWLEVEQARVAVSAWIS